MMAVNVAEIENLAVRQVYQRYPQPYQTKLLQLRQLLLATARRLDRVGPIEETLRWGEPSYLTQETRSGSLIRLAWKKSRPNQYGIYFHCQTTIIEMIREIHGNVFCYEGRRALVFGPTDQVDEVAVADCFAMALTYHLT